MMTKLKKGPSPLKASNRSKIIAELWHLDVLMNNIECHSESKYVLTMTDDCSRFVKICLLADKGSIAPVLISLINQIKTQMNSPIKIIRSDNGAEFINNEVNQLCKDHGIIHQRTIEYSPNQNGVAERLNQTLMNNVRAMLKESKLPDVYWDEAILNAAFTHNLCPNAANPDFKTPWSLFHPDINPHPSIGEMQVFGVRGFAITNPQERNNSARGKLADTGQKVRFMGYCYDAKGYRLLTEDGRIIRRKYEDCKFPPTNDQPLPESKLRNNHNRNKFQRKVVAFEAHQDTDDDAENTEQEDHNNLVNEEFTCNAEGQTSCDIPIDTDSIPDDESLDEMFSKNEEVQEKEDEIMLHDESLPENMTTVPALTPANKRARNVAFSPNSTPRETKRFITDSSLHCIPPKSNLPIELAPNDIDNPPAEIKRIPILRQAKATTLKKEIYIPNNYQEAITCQDKDMWLEAIQEEMASLTQHQTWDMVPIPEGCNVVKNKWIFSIKKGIDTEIRYKARLVACGYSQVEGIDYKEIFSPVVKSESIRILLAVAAGRDMNVHHMDVKTAFLYGTLKEEIYMAQPKGMTSVESPDWVCKLNKGLYGLKQSPRVWYEEITNTLISMNFKALVADPCIFYKKENNYLSIISLHVDDLIIAVDKECKELENIKKILKGKFQMHDLGELNEALGLKFRRDRGNKSFYISAIKKIDQLLATYNMTECSPISTPAASDLILQTECPEPGSKEAAFMTTIPYRECIGSLIHIMKSSRPDIGYPVGVLSRYLHNPSEQHWNAAKQIMRYLKGTRDFEMQLHNNQRDNFQVFAMCDANWAGWRPKAKSTSGYVTYIGNSTLSWSSKLQSLVATSTVMAEFIAIEACMDETLWIKAFLLELGLLNTKPEGNSNVTIHCDSQSAIKLAKNQMITDGNKSWITKYNSVQDNLKRLVIELQYCPTESNTADILTKVLAKNKIQFFSKQLGLVRVKLSNQSKDESHDQV
jgi:hypothetical protein